MSILRFIRDEKFLKNPKESLESILDFYSYIKAVKRDAEKDPESYWRNRGYKVLQDVNNKNN